MGYFVAILLFIFIFLIILTYEAGYDAACRDFNDQEQTLFSSIIERFTDL